MGQITGGAGDEACDVMFVVFYIAKTNTSKVHSPGDREGGPHAPSQFPEA